MNLIELQKPMPLKWRVQRAHPNKNNPTHVIMIGYIDSREIQKRLDDVVGIENWQNKFYESRGKQFCEIGIKIDGEWIWKGDSGTPSQTEKEKGESSDAFKRAAVHWGINRFAYQVGEVKLPCKIYSGKPYPCDERGNFLKAQALFDYCNKEAKIEELEIEFDENFDKEKSSSKIDKYVIDQWNTELKNCKTIADVDKLFRQSKPTLPEILELFQTRKREINGGF